MEVPLDFFCSVRVQVGLFGLLRIFMSTLESKNGAKIKHATHAQIQHTGNSTHAQSAPNTFSFLPST